MKTQTTPATLVINPALGKYVPRPIIARRTRGRGQKITANESFNANSGLIVKLRERDFSWVEIAATLKTFGIDHSVISLHQWKAKNFKAAKKKALTAKR